MEEKKVQLLSKLHELATGFTGDMRIDDIINIVLTYALVSALSVNDIEKGMEFIRDCLSDAVEIRREYDRKHNGIK